MLRTLTTITGPPGAPFYAHHYFGGNTANEALQATLAVDAFWLALTDGIQSPAAITISTEVEQVDPGNGQVVAVFPSPPHNRVGAGAGEPLPPATQGLIRWRTGVFVNGRELRGRTFIPAQLEAFSQGGIPTPGWQSDMQDAAQALVSGSVGAGGFGIYSTTHRQFAVAIGGGPWNQWAVMRSRRP